MCFANLVATKGQDSVSKQREMQNAQARTQRAEGATTTARPTDISVSSGAVDLAPGSKVSPAPTHKTPDACVDDQAIVAAQLVDSVADEDDSVHSFRLCDSSYADWEAFYS